jgi:hypothetical protein
VTNVFLTPDFDTPDPSGEPGACADWVRETHQGLPGFAAFAQPHGFFDAAERFQWEDRPARIIGTVGAPFRVGAAFKWFFPVAGVTTTPDNLIHFAGVDIRAALPPGCSFRVDGIAPDLQLDGYWTVIAVAFDGTDSAVAVEEEVYAMAPGALASIAAVVQCQVCDHGWAAAVIDETIYPLAPIIAAQTVIVRIDRGAPQTVSFVGGETTAADVAAVIDEVLLGGGARVTAAGQVQIYTDTVGPSGSVQVEIGSAALVFQPWEETGRGQWAQPWPLYFSTPGSASIHETVEWAAAHWRHVKIGDTGAVSGARLLLRSERSGAAASLVVDDSRGGIHDAATWPIGARTPGIDDELLFEIDGAPVVVTLAIADRTPDLVAARIAAAFTMAGADAMTYGSPDRVYVDSRLSVWCAGGTANAEIKFPTTATAYGGGDASTALGLRGASSVGVTDVGWFASFADVVSEFAEFSGGTPVAGMAETFTWADVFPTLDSTTHAEAPFCSWYGVRSGNPNLWPSSAESFDEGWRNEWLSTYTAALPVAGAWKPPGTSPDAQLVGRDLTFPLRITANRNRLAIYSETDLAWYTFSITPASYVTATALAAELEVQRVASGMTDGVRFRSVGNALTLGWDGVGGSAGAIHLASPAPPLTDQDARPSLGLWPLAAAPGAASVAVAVGFYSGAPPATWGTASYGVDPYSRLVFTSEQTPAGAPWTAPANGEKQAVFNALDPLLADTNADDFAWWTPIPAGTFTTWPLAVFDASISPETYEDFEEGW